MRISDDLILDPLDIKHAPSIFYILDTEREYMRVWLPFVDKTREIADLEKSIDNLVDGVNKQFCICYKEELVGLVGFKDTDADNQKTEIGYWLSQKVQRKGVMTRSVKALLIYAFEKMGMNRVQIKAAIGNKPSCAIPERLNFRMEGIERDGELLVDNRFTDIAVYSLLKKELEDNYADYKIS